MPHARISCTTLAPDVREAEVTVTAGIAIGETGVVHAENVGQGGVEQPARR